MNEQGRATARRPRVLLVFTSSGIGGAERSLTRMALHGADAVEYQLLTFGGEGEWARWARSLGAEVQVFELFSCRAAAVRSLFSCVASLRRLRADVVYVVGLKSAILLRLLRPAIPGKIVHAIRSSFPRGSYMRRKFALAELLLGWLTDHYIANSQAGARDLRDMTGADARRVSVIYNGLTVLTPIDAPFAERPPRVVVVANITGQKGHLELLPVIVRARTRVPDMQVWFVGRNELGDLLQQSIAQFGLENCIRVPGFSNSPEGTLRSARVFALPTLQVEGCPTALIEAMALGLAVVAYDVGGIPEIITSGVNGLLVPAGDALAFASALVQLLTNAKLNERLGRAARETVLDKFSLQRCAAQHVQVWQRLMTRSDAYEAPR